MTCVRQRDINCPKCGADLISADKVSYHDTGKGLTERAVEALEAIASAFGAEHTAGGVGPVVVDIVGLPARRKKK